MYIVPGSHEYGTVFLQCVCAPGWIGEFCQYVSDACLIKPNRCLNGATCITTGQPSSPPQYTCICPHGFTGEITLLYYLCLPPFHLSVRLSVGRISQKVDQFSQTLVGRLVKGNRMTDWCLSKIWHWTGTSWQLHGVDVCVLLWHLQTVLLCRNHVNAMYIQCYAKLWSRHAT